MSGQSLILILLGSSGSQCSKPTLKLEPSSLIPPTGVFQQSLAESCCEQGVGWVLVLHHSYLLGDLVELELPFAQQE